MIWTDDDNLVREKRKPGRPEVNPFPSTEMEEDFARRGRRMLDLYWRDTGSNAKANLFFTATRHMSKTLFWSMIYLYLTQHGMMPNLLGYLSAVQKHFGSEVACDRASVAKKVAMLEKLRVQYKHLADELLSPADQRASRQYRPKYEYIVQLWETN